MKISIITICFNNERDIRNTIESVINQTYPDIEYIIKDGGSTDRTLNIVNEYKDRISKIISCKDNGIYDAINQGIEASTGDIVGLIHAGDRLYESTTIEKIAKFHEKENVDISYGGSASINEKGETVRINRNPTNLPKKWIKYGWMPSHMSIYAKKDIFIKHGLYRTDMPIAGDYEWFLRCFLKNGNKCRIKGMDDIILFFQLGGVSSQDGMNKLSKKQKKMLEDCWTVNGLIPPQGLLYMRLWWGIRIILQGIWETKILRKKI